MSRTRFIPIIEEINGHLDKLYDTFKRIFSIDNDTELFDDYWRVISPREFMLDDRKAIDQYYDKQIERIPAFLRARDKANLSDVKKSVLSNLTNLCHRLARLKNGIIRLTDACHRHNYTDAYENVRQNLSEDVFASQINSRYIRQETLALESFFYKVGSWLMTLGYIKHNDIQSESQQYNSTMLPPNLRQQLDLLLSNTRLNEAIAQLEAARKNKQPLNAHIDQLAQAIHDIHDARDTIDTTADQTLFHYQEVIERVGIHAQNLTTRLRKLQEYEFIFNLTSILNDITEILQLTTIRSTVRSMTDICNSNQSVLSSATRGMISDPWVESRTVLTNINQLENQIRIYISDSIGGGDSLPTLNRQYTDFQKRVTEMCQHQQRMVKSLQQAQQAKANYLQGCDNTMQILREHLASHNAYTLTGFAGRHWWKVLGGGVTGAGLATSVLLLTTNPITLTLLIAAGGVLGSAGGAGGGLVQDVIEEKCRQRQI